MRQDFSKVTAEQLAQLFPIIHETHNLRWPVCYQQEKQQLEKLFGQINICRISHIGSTAIESILAKPTIDILIEITPDAPIEVIKERMLDQGYVINMPPADIVLFLKGYTPQGFRGQAYHIHVRKYGDWDELYFRDYLIAHEDTAREYQQLKIQLKEMYPNNRDGYTEAKRDFVKQYSQKARLAFPDRYLPH